MKRSVLRRMLDRPVLLVASLAVIGVAIAWLMVREEPPTYARQLAFVIRPGPGLDASQVPDAVRGVSQASSELVFTVARVIETDPFRRPRGAALGPDYAIHASVPPATNVVHVQVRGPDAEALRRFQAGYAKLASDWVTHAYPAYRLEFLEGKAGPDPARRTALERIGLAGLLGLLAGLLVLFVDSKLDRREPPVRVRDKHGRPAGPRARPPRTAAAARYNGHAASSHPPVEHGAARRHPGV